MPPPLAPTFSKLAPPVFNLPATPFDSLLVLDPYLREHAAEYGTRFRNVFNDEVMTMLGSACLLPVGELDIQSSTPTVERLAGLLHHLQVDYSARLCSMFDLNRGTRLTLHSTKSWPGYYLIVRSMDDAVINGFKRAARTIRVFVFKLMPR
jgi:hypothetical protein